MEKNTNDLANILELPAEIKQHIASYLDASTLSFFAQSDKQTLINVLPLLIKYQAMYSFQLTAGGINTFFYQANQLFVCGFNEHGQLGLGDKENRFIFTAVPWPDDRGRIQQVIAGQNHTIVLTEDNRLWGCGDNSYGQLGLRNKENQLTFTAVPWPEEQGQIRQVIAGGYQTVVLTQDNRLWVCGNNDFGQLGLGDRVPRCFTFTAVPWPEERGRIQQMVIGGGHTVVLTDNNQLWVCGRNYYGQLGLGDQALRSTFTAVPWPAERGKIQQIIASVSYTVVLTQDNRLWGCGSNSVGELGLSNDVLRATTFTAVPWPEEQGRIEQVIAGRSYTLVLTQDNRLWGCGYNGDGQLGLGDKTNRSSFTAVPWPDARGRIQQIIVGQAHSVAVTQGNRLWVCGDNFYGELGLGNKTDRSTFTLVKKLHVFKFKQLIKIGTALAQTSNIQSALSHSQSESDESDESDSKPISKKLRCNLQ